MMLIYLPQEGDFYRLIKHGRVCQTGKILYVNDPLYNELLERRFSGGWSIDSQWQDSTEDTYRESQPFTEVFGIYQWHKQTRQWTFIGE